MDNIFTQSLSAHPENSKIYGDSFDSNLLSKIEKVGILTPLLITKNRRIISGHRRWECAKKLGLETVPAMTFESDDENDILEAMIMANEQRERNNEQKAREFTKLKEIEAARAKVRQAEYHGNQHESGLVENLPQVQGKSRDLAAAKVGMSGKTAEKAAEVVQVIDAMEQTGETGRAGEIRDKLNKSVNSAYNSVKPVIEEKKKVNAEIKQASQEVEHLSDKLAICRSTNLAYKPTFNFTNENINWAGWSWNPVTGCLHGCPYCYARAIATNSYYQDAFPTQFKPTFHPGRLTAPQNTTIPKDKQAFGGIRRVFVCSMADLFGDWVPIEWIQAIIDACEENMQWDFLFLTKNPKRYLEFEFPKNCWLGATADTQARADNAINVFKRITENLKFLSCEPLLERITFRSEYCPTIKTAEITRFGNEDDWEERHNNDDGGGDLGFIDLLIIGALKGSEKNPEKQPKWEWVQSLIVQAVEAGVSYVFKPNLVVRPEQYPDSLVER